MSSSGERTMATAVDLNARQLAARIDHTLLKPDAREADVARLCEQAIRYQFATVCVNSIWVPLCAKLLADSPTAVCTTVGFPLGAVISSAKVYETEQAVAAGADEVDMVVWIGGLRDGKTDEVQAEIAGVVAAAAPAIVKVILETGLLTQEEKRTACRLAHDAGAHFVKTSTGFGAGATTDDVALLRASVGRAMGVKASGGIRTRADALAMLGAGANRIGTSSGVAIIEEMASAGDAR